MSTPKFPDHIVLNQDRFETPQFLNPKQIWGNFPLLWMRVCQKSAADVILEINRNWRSKDQFPTSFMERTGKSRPQDINYDICCCFTSKKNRSNESSQTLHFPRCFKESVSQQNLQIRRFLGCFLTCFQPPSLGWLETPWPWPAGKISEVLSCCFF